MYQLLGSVKHLNSIAGFCEWCGLFKCVRCCLKNSVFAKSGCLLTWERKSLIASRIKKTDRIIILKSTVEPIRYIQLNLRQKNEELSLHQLLRTSLTSRRVERFEVEVCDLKCWSQNIVLFDTDQITICKYETIQKIKRRVNTDIKNRAQFGWDGVSPVRDHRSVNSVTAAVDNSKCSNDGMTLRWHGSASRGVWCDYGCAPCVERVRAVVIAQFYFFRCPPPSPPMVERVPPLARWDALKGFQTQRPYARR